MKLEHMPTRHRLHPQEVAWSQHSQRALVTALNSDASALSGGDYWTVHCGDPPSSGSGSSNGTSSSASSSKGGGAGTTLSTAPGAPIPHGARVRLQSAATKKWLMASAEHRSPMTSNDEVSGYDAEKSGSPEAKAVVWVVEWDGQGAALPPPEEDEDDDGGAAGDADAKKKKAAEADKRKKDLAAAAKLLSKQGFWGGSTIVRLKHASSGHWLSSYERARFGHPLTGQQEVSTATGRPGGQEQWRAAEGVYLPVEHGAVLAGGGGEGGAKKDEL